MLIDQYLPHYDFNAVHQVNVNASSKQVYQAIIELTPTDLSPLVFAMLNFRQLPARITGKSNLEKLDHQPFLDQLFDGGFIPLADEPGREIVFGLIGQFWKLVGNQGPPLPITNEQAFLDFDDLDYAKVVANLAVWDNAGTTHCSTETRISVPHPPTRRKFASYWRLISMGSGWIRVLWLRAIKQKAEKAKF